MRIDYFRIPDIAKRTGIPEQTVAEYAQTFDEFLTYATDADTRYYTPDAMLLMRKIDSYVREGKTTEEIREAIDREYPQLREQKEIPSQETACPEDVE
ncbi:MAG TPA: MerR family transcriptional regulator [Methanoculleus sp.]|nr:MerR family transcriptional regulator [Methanoculleus sp.]